MTFARVVFSSVTNTTPKSSSSAKSTTMSTFEKLSPLPRKLITAQRRLSPKFSLSGATGKILLYTKECSYLLYKLALPAAAPAKVAGGILLICGVQFIHAVRAPSYALGDWILVITYSPD